MDENKKLEYTPNEPLETGAEKTGSPVSPVSEPEVVEQKIEEAMPSEEPAAPEAPAEFFAEKKAEEQPAPAPQSGEYRYVPPYADNNSTDRVRATYTVPPAWTREPEKKEEKKSEKKEKSKTVRTFSTTALALILVGTIILSFASGMLGALLVNGGLEIIDNSKNDSDDDLVIDRVEDDDKDTNDDLVVDKNDDENESTADKLVGSYDISDVCAVVSASVVEITTEFNKTQYGYFQYVESGAGSGVIISNNGYIVTNAHVITDSNSGKLADAIKIRLNTGDEYQAEIIGSDNESDIALIKVEAEGLMAATVGDSDKIKVGEQVIAVGNPLGELGGTITSGIVSATNREISVQNNKMTLIQIDAAVNPGNSGGGLFNTNGELIGIVNAKTTDVTVEGLGFAIPVNEAVNVAEELQSHGYVTGKVHIGISLTDVTDAFTAYYYFRSESTGVYITNVQEGYNEDVLEYGDRITAINDVEVTSSADVKEIIAESKVGDKLTFTISRKGKLKDVVVICYEYVPTQDVTFEED